MSMNPIFHSLGESGEFQVLDPYSIGLFPTQLSNPYETFFLVLGSEERLCISNAGYAIEFVEDGFIKHEANRDNDGIISIQLSDGSEKSFDLAELMMIFHRHDEGDKLFPLDRHAYHLEIRNNVVLNEDDSWTNLKLLCKDRTKWEQFIYSLKGAMRHPKDENSLTFFAPHKVATQRLSGVRERPLKKDGYKNVRVGIEWSRDNPDAHDNMYWWTVTNYYYHPLPLQLDKDVLSLWEDELVYSYDTCLYIPYDINEFFRRSVVNEIESDCYEANHFREYRDKIQFFIERENLLEPKIQHQSHRKLIKQLEYILNEMTAKHIE